MTTVYRIGFSLSRSLRDHAYGSTLSDGRWHTRRLGPPQRQVAYAASSRALAQLEKRVHANGVLPVGQALFALTFAASVEPAQPVGLPADWRDDISRSQAYGDAWLDARASLAMWVPSFVEPAESNVLINPDHADAATITILVERDPFVFDPRLR